jgi:serine/threonine protein kinase/Tol biopolymer transport system component
VLLSCDGRADGRVQSAVRSELAAVGFPLTGETISHYRILDGVGGGGMGLVYRAEDIRLGRLVALKFLPEESVKDPAALRRFEREARSASALEHPNICPIYEFGEHEGQPFLVMQLLEGQTLRELISAESPGNPRLELSKLLDLAIQITDGLDAAHRHGIIHRDIKPANIFVTSEGQAKILDFGLAKLARVSSVAGDDAERDPGDGVAAARPRESVPATTPDPFLSRTGVAMGTAGYMSPEQVRGEELDARTDLFSVGLVLYEMATGKRAFAGDTEPALQEAILKQVPGPARELNPKLPAKLEQVINKALEKDRKARYQAAAEMCADLKSLRQKVQAKRAAVPWWGIVAGVFVLLGSSAAFWFIAHHSSSQRALPELRQRQLTDSSSENAVAGGALSADGKYLAYSDASGIKIKLIETGETQPVPQPDELKDKGVDWRVRSWFPDGTRFLANAIPRGLRPYEIGSRGTSIWMVSLLGGAPHKLRDNAFAYSVSPDGSLISFGANWGSKGDREIWLMGPTGEQVRKLYDTDEDSSITGAVWSPDGKLTAYTRIDDAGSSLVVRDLKGGSPTTLSSPETALVDYLWLPDGRMVYSLNEPDTNGFTCNFWGRRLDGHTGKPVEEARRLTSWSDFCMNFAGATANGHKLAFLKWRPNITTYVANLDASGSYVSNPRHLPPESLGTVGDWTADSTALIFSDGHLDKQFLNGDAEPIAAPKGGVGGLCVSSDGKWVLYFPQEEVSKKSATALNPAPVMRVPINGGPSQQVFTAEPGSILRCSRHPSDLCAIAEPVGNPKRVIVTAFDPLKGRGSELTRFALNPNSDDWDWDLSPDGTRIAAVQNPAGPIYILSLRGQPTQEVWVKGWSNLKSVNWSAHGNGLFVSSDYERPGGAALLHVDLQGHASVLWKQLEAFSVAPSPDGRYLAFSGSTLDANIWMMENF